MVGWPVVLLYTSDGESRSASGTYIKTISNGEDTVSDDNNTSYICSTFSVELGLGKFPGSLIAVKVAGCPTRIAPY